MFQGQKIAASSFSNINVGGNSLFERAICLTGIPVKFIPYSVLEQLRLEMKFQPLITLGITKIEACFSCVCFLMLSQDFPILPFRFNMMLQQK